MNHQRWTFGIAAIVIGLSLSVAQAQQYVYPAKGQSKDQQKKDEAACYTWAVEQTGFDPAKATASAPAQAAPVAGSGAMVKGAAAGAVIGGATGGSAGEGAAIGAAVGGIARRSANKKAAEQQNAAAAQQVQGGMAAYQKARTACLEGRGYTVK